MEKYIEFEHIGKTFPGQKALDDVSFSIRKGEIHAIIGENGAGKSTLLNILHGVFPATTGEIKINGKTVKFSNVADAIENGIAKVHQEIVSIPYADILTFSSRLHYVDILTVDGKCYEQMSTLNKIIVHLPSEFIRTHRSYIVNMAHIYRITSGTIELSNHLTTQIARSYSKDVISAFAKYTTRFDTSGDFE